MRLITLLISGILAVSPAAAQPSQPATPSASTNSPSSNPDAKAATSELPVSLDRIREGLERPTSAHVFTNHFNKSLDKEPNFRIQIEERRKIEELLSTLNFKSGPVPAGGLYAYEQQRMMVPSVDNPLAQPYAAFNQGQLLTILVENLVGKHLAGQAIESITKSVRERAEAEARREVDEAVTEYCAAKPNNGAGIQLCTPQPAEPGR